MGFALTATEQQWLDRANALAAEFAATARKYDEAAAFPAEHFERLREEGFLALPVPEEFGGYGNETGNHTRIVHLVIQALATTCPGTAWCYSLHTFACGIIARLGNDEQRHRILGDVAKNGVLVASIGSEVNVRQTQISKDAARRFTVESELRPVEGGFIANGTKHFGTIGSAAKYILFWTIAPGTETQDEGLTLVVIPAASEGVSFDSTGWDEIIGIRSSVSYKTVFNDVFVPWENVLGQPGDYIQNDPYTVSLEHAAVLTGAAKGAFDYIIKSLRGLQFLTLDTATMNVVGEMDAELQAACASLEYALWLWEEKRFGDAELASMRALHSAKSVARFITTRGFEVVGTRAVFKFNPLERLWRDARVVSLHTRQSQILQLLAEGVVAGEFFPKQKYGARVEQRRTWADLGLQPAVERAD